MKNIQRESKIILFLFFINHFSFLLLFQINEYQTIKNKIIVKIIFNSSTGKIFKINTHKKLPKIQEIIKKMNHFSNLFFLNNIIVNQISLPNTAELSNAKAFFISIQIIDCRKNCVTILHHHIKFQYNSHKNTHRLAKIISIFFIYIN